MLIPIGTICGTVCALAGKGVAVKTESTLRATWTWALLLTMSVVTRDMLDWWLAPTQEFYARSIVSTWIAIAIFVACGAAAVWRSRSILASARAGVVTGLLAAVAIDLAILIQLGVRHDPHTMRMIAASGGLDEAFLLPFVVIVPGTAIAVAAGAVAKAFAFSAERLSLNSRR